MSRLVLAFLISLFFMGSSFAQGGIHDSDLDEMMTLIPKINSTKCKFTQEKAVKNSSVVLKSGGDFVFEKNKGVTFYTNYPVKQVASYSRYDYRQINNIVNSISNGDYSILEREFNFEFEYDNRAWYLKLVPKENSRTHKYLSSVEVNGEDEIKAIKITTPDFITNIRFFK